MVRVLLIENVFLQNIKLIYLFQIFYMGSDIINKYQPIAARLQYYFKFILKYLKKILVVIFDDGL